MTLLLYAVHDLLDAVLEVPAILRARQQRTDVELVDATALQAFRHLSLLNHPRQSPHEGRLAHTGFTHVQRIILIPSAQHLDRPFQFLLTSYQRVMLLIQLVHAGHQPSPSRLVLPFARLLFQMVVELIEADQLAHEVTLLIDERVLQQIARPRLLQAQDAHHEVG